VSLCLKVFIRVAHEIAHHIDEEVFGGFSKKSNRPWLVGPRAKIFAEELKGVSYDKEKVYEGFAEFVRLWATLPEQAKARAPQFSIWFENFVKDNGRFGPPLIKAKKGMLAWYGQGNLAKMKSKIGEPPELNKNYTLADEVRQSVFDDFHGIYRMVEKLGNTKLGKEAYMASRITRGSGAVTDGTLRYGHISVKENGDLTFRGKSLDKILAPIADNLDEWELYAIARGTKRLSERGKTSGFSKAEIDAGLSLETPEFKQAFDDYQEWNSATLDFAEHAGVLDPESRKFFDTQNYLPFYRAGFDSATGKSQGVPGSSSIYHRLKGSNRNIRSVLGNMIENQNLIIRTSFQNIARQKIAKLVSTEKGGGKFMVKIGKDAKALPVAKEQLREKVYDLLNVPPAFRKAYGKALEDILDFASEDDIRNAIKKAAADARKDGQNELADIFPAIAEIEISLSKTPDFTNFWLLGQSPGNKENVVAVMNRGKPTYYEVGDALLFRALESFNRPELTGIQSILNIPRRIGQTSVTLSIDFMVRNIARDTILGSILTFIGLVFSFP